MNELLCNIVAPLLRRVLVLMLNYLHNTEILLDSYNKSRGRVMGSKPKRKPLNDLFDVSLHS